MAGKEPHLARSRPFLLSELDCITDDMFRTNQGIGVIHYLTNKMPSRQGLANISHQDPRRRGGPLHLDVKVGVDVARHRVHIGAVLSLPSAGDLIRMNKVDVADLGRNLQVVDASVSSDFNLKSAPRNEGKS